MCRYTGKRKGFFLVFSLWIFILLSLFCLGLGFRTSITVKKTKLIINRKRAFYLGVSGIKVARNILARDEGPTDYLQEEWSSVVGEQVYFSSPKREGAVTIAIEDESSRLNINKAKESALKKLFEEDGVEDAQKKLNYILDYIDQDAEPREFDSEEHAKNQELSVLEEVLLIPALSSKDVRHIEEFCTVFGDDRKVNINTAKEELLTSLIEDESVRNQVFEVRYGPNGIEGDEDDEYFGEGGHPLPTELQEEFKTESNLFRVTSKAEVEGAKQKISCIIKKDSGKILYWYEK